MEDANTIIGAVEKMVVAPPPPPLLRGAVGSRHGYPEPEDSRRNESALTALYGKTLTCEDFERVAVKACAFQM